MLFKALYKTKPSYCRAIHITNNCIHLEWNEHQKMSNSKVFKAHLHIVPLMLSFLFKSHSVGVTCCPKLDIFQSVGIMHGKLNGLCTKMWFNRVVIIKTRDKLCTL